MAEKTGNETTVKTKDGRVYYPGYTLSEVTVKKTYKGNLQEGDTVTVYEPYLSYQENDEMITTHIKNYAAMETGKEYILYLIKTTGSAYKDTPLDKWCETWAATGDNDYMQSQEAPASAWYELLMENRGVLGKINISDDEALLYTGDEDKIYDGLSDIDSTLELMQTMREGALKRINEE